MTRIMLVPAYWWGVFFGTCCLAPLLSILGSLLLLWLLDRGSKAVDNEWGRIGMQRQRRGVLHWWRARRAARQARETEARERAARSYNRHLQRELEAQAIDRQRQRWASLKAAWADAPAEAH